MQEKRLYPRVKIKLEATFTCPSGDPVYTQVKNVSSGGLLVDGDIVLKEQLTQNTNPVAPSPAEAVVTIMLPGDKQPIRSRCRLVFVRRLSQLEFSFGFRFINMDESDAKHLHQYLVSQDSI